MSYFFMAAYVRILRKLISWSFYNRALPKSNLKSGSAPEYVISFKRLCCVECLKFEETRKEKLSEVYLDPSQKQPPEVFSKKWCS